MDHLLAFDMETTGVSVQETRPVQVCLVQEEAGVRRVLMNARCNPCMPIEEGAEAVHGISDKDVRYMPDFAMVMYQLRLLLGQVLRKDSVLVTMNGKAFDVPIADRLFEGAVLSPIPHFDVYQAACRYFPDLKSRKLGDLYTFFFGIELQNAHDAAADNHAVLDVAAEIVKRSGKGLPELVAELNKPAYYPIIPFGKHAGKTIDEVPKGWAVFMNKQGGLSPDLQATVNYILSR
jgi:DNA polymerase-3 subunit epsilon